MESNETVSQKEALEKLYSFVMGKMKVGADKSSISQELVDMGMDKGDATELVESIYAHVLKAAEEEQVIGSSFLPAMVGGGLAAVIGGVLWGLIVIATGYVIGFMAWGIGLLSGFAVVLFSKGRRGVPLQIIAILSSVFGIAVGKYVTFFHFFKEAVLKKYGAEVASNISIFSEEVIYIFIDGIGSMVSGFDILWVILAVITAWRIPKGIGIKLAK